MPLPGAARSPATYLKWVIFSGPWILLAINLTPASSSSRAAGSVLAFAAGYVSLLLFDTWRCRAELREQAWQAWIARAKSTAVPYGVSIEDDDEDEWRAFFRAGLKPHEAVAQFRSCL